MGYKSFVAVDVVIAIVVIVVLVAPVAVNCCGRNRLLHGGRCPKNGRSRPTIGHAVLNGWRGAS